MRDTEPPVVPDPVSGLLSDLQAYVEFLKEEGASAVEVSRPFCAWPASPAPAAAPAVNRASGKRPDPDRAMGVASKPGRAAVPAPVPTPMPAPRKEPVVVQAEGDPAQALARVAAEVAVCKKCRLHQTRKRTVPGQGHPRPEILFVGEGPGADEDAQGLAFVGAAGQLLTRMIEAMGLTREEVFIANIVKCRPPENRKPEPDEVAACLPYLQAQIAILKPRVMVGLGATAVYSLMKMDTPISRLRGKWLSYQGVDLMPTFHPSYLLRDPSKKKEVWEDLQEVLRRIGRTPPARKKPET